MTANVKRAARTPRCHGPEAGQGPFVLGLHDRLAQQYVATIVPLSSVPGCRAVAGFGRDHHDARGVA